MPPGPGTETTGRRHRRAGCDRVRQRGTPGQAGRAVPRLRGGRDDPAVADPGGPDALPSPAQGGAAPVALGGPAAAGRAQRRTRPGRTRRGAPGHQPRQPGPARRPVHDAHLVGGDPVPGPARGRPGAPAQPVGVPVRPAGRGSVDGGGRGPGRDAPGGPAADPGLGVPRPPERLGHPHGLAGRAGHPARPTPSGCGAAPVSPRSRWPGRARPRRWSPTAGRTPTRL